MLKAGYTKQRKVLCVSNVGMEDERDRRAIPAQAETCGLRGEARSPRSRGVMVMGTRLSERNAGRCI
jgi:hypothetical protein